MGIEQQLSSLNQNRGGVVFNLGPTLDVELEKQDMHPEALLVAAGSMTYYAMPLTNNRIPTFFDIRNSSAFNGSTRDYIQARLQVLSNLGDLSDAMNSGKSSLDEMRLYESEIIQNMRMNEQNFNMIKKRARNPFPLSIFFGSINEETLNELGRRYMGWRVLEVLSENYHHDLKRDADCIDNMDGNPEYPFLIGSLTFPGMPVSQDLSDNLRTVAELYLRISSHACNEAQRTRNRYQELSEIYHGQNDDFASTLKILEEKVFNYLRVRVLAVK